MKFLKKNWWKVLTVLLLVYTLVFSLMVPLAPGIESVTPKQLNVGENTVVVEGYNTQFTKNIPSEITINYGEDIVSSDNFEIIDDNHLKFKINIPKQLPSKNLHLKILGANCSFIFAPEIIKVYDAEKIKTEPTIGISGRPCLKNDININIPNRLLLNETIRNLMFHVPMWFAMMLILTVSFFYSIKFLRGFDLKNDLIATQAVNIGLLFAALGLLTGMVWAKFTWSEHTEVFSLSGWWANDVKLNGAAITTLIYIAYRILRRSIDDEHKKAKISAVYNIFAFVMMIVFIMVLPRITDSLHPGNGGNPAFSKYDLDNTLRMVFYPAVLGWILLGIWMLNLNIRLNRLKNRQDDVA